MILRGIGKNYVNVQLSINGYNTCYWETGHGAEIDFIIQRDGPFIPVEVKSADNTRAKSREQKEAEKECQSALQQEKSEA